MAFVTVEQLATALQVKALHVSAEIYSQAVKTTHAVSAWRDKGQQRVSMSFMTVS